MTSDTIYLQHNGNTVKLELEKRKDRVILKKKTIWLGDGAGGAAPLKEKEK